MNRGSTRTTDYHPWRHAETLGVDVVYADLEDILGYWDAEARTIVLARGLTQRQRRAVLAHECEHASHDDRPLIDAAANAKRERATDVAAARRLIPIGGLAEALLWTGDIHELAVELWVDLHTIRTRLASLTSAERRHVEAHLRASREGGAA